MWTVRCAVTITSTKIRWASSKVKPVDLAEFRSFLDSLGKFGAGRAPQSQPQERPLIGLAISGGVDSMALCTLAREAAQAHSSQINENSRAGPPPRFHAFIVDHKVRPGSTDEAHKVSEVLESMDLSSEVVTLEWPTDQPPSRVTNFETTARRLRYQALGRACRAKGIATVLLGHHEDDVAEGVLLRIINGSHHGRLGGIPSAANIPECHGMHGVHQSGGPLYSNGTNILTKFGGQASFTNLTQLPTSHPKFPPLVPIESGGITIHRPFLHHPKSRLIATCTASGTPWFDDPTNHDQSLTNRNTIRHLLAKDRLPIALRKPSLLALAARSSAKLHRRTALAHSLMTACEISSLDLRTGQMLVRLPALPFGPSTSLAEIHHTTALFIRNLLLLVSPTDNIPLSTLQTATLTLYPALQSPSYNTHSPLGSDTSPEAFTIAGVHLRPSHPPHSNRNNPLPFSLSTSSPSSSTTPTSTTLSIPTPTTTPSQPSWTLTRQPLPNKPSHPPPTLTFPPLSIQQPNIQQPTTPLNPVFHLWDNRYWVHLHNPSKKTLIVQPLRESRWKTWETALGNDDRKRVKRALKEGAWGKARWGVMSVWCEEGGEVVGLPTLGVWKPGWGCGRGGDSGTEDTGTGGGERGERGVRCEVRYKLVRNIAEVQQ